MCKNTDIHQQKSATRKILKAARANIPENERLAHAKIITAQILQLEPLQTTEAIFIYISYATEVHTHALIKTLLQGGKTLVVPMILAPEPMQAVYLNDWEALQPGELGIPVPIVARPCQQDIDIVITPGLGFTQSGHRIGYGRGYYDQWFSQHKVRHKIALAFEAQLLNSIPIEKTDICMGTIVTEKRVINVTKTDHPA